MNPVLPTIYRSVWPCVWYVTDLRTSLPSFVDIHVHWRWYNFVVVHWCWYNIVGVHWRWYNFVVVHWSWYNFVDDNLYNSVRLRLLVDVSGSMYRFNGYDGRLEREMEAVCMVMEAFQGYEDKLKVSCQPIQLYVPVMVRILVITNSVNFRSEFYSLAPEVRSIFYNFRFIYIYYSVLLSACRWTKSLFRTLLTVIIFTFSCSMTFSLYVVRRFLSM